MWRKRILPYFHYNKKERAGIIALLIVVVLLWAIPFFFAELADEADAPDITVIAAAVHQLDKQRTNGIQSDSAVSMQVAQTAQKDRGAGNYAIAPFDPNTASTGEWASMGIQPKTVTIIQNYLAKGGRFHKKEDLQKVYGLKGADYERLAPFIHINSAVNNAEVSRGSADKMKKKPDSSRRRFSNKIDINTADKEAWESLPGIGEKLATRIIAFREKLGGFTTVNQVAETYGIETEVFNLILPRLENEHAAAVKKVALNSAAFDELKQHPYIGYRLAKLLVAYREQHGDFRQLSDLMNIPLITNEIAFKLSPYLEFEAKAVLPE